MAARPGVTVSVRRSVDGGRPPHNYIAAITVEIRAFWPPLASASEIEAALQEAVTKAREEISLKRSDLT
jgi:hypothetical protein